MRKVTAGLFHSVDGVVEDPFKFQFDSFDDQLGEMLTGVQGKVDTVLSKGKVIVSGDQYLGAPGDGEYLPRGTSHYVI